MMDIMVSIQRRVGEAMDIRSARIEFALRVALRRGTPFVDIADDPSETCAIRLSDHGDSLVGYGCRYDLSSLSPEAAQMLRDALQTNDWSAVYRAIGV